MPELDPKLIDLSDRVHTLLAAANIAYKEFEHEPVFDYITAKQVRERFNLTGLESKSLFLKSKDGQFCMLVTLEDRRADLKAIKQLLSKKVSIATGEELQSITGCPPGCAVPLGLPGSVTIIVDSAIFKTDKFIFSPGPPTATIQINGSDLRPLFDKISSSQPVLFMN